MNNHKQKPTLPAPWISESKIKMKINLFYFLTSLWFLKRFYRRLQITFWITTSKCENKSLFKLIFSLLPRLGREGLQDQKNVTQSCSNIFTVNFEQVQLIFFFSLLALTLRLISCWKPATSRKQGGHAFYWMALYCKTK